MALRTKRPRFKINDRVALASYTPLVPAYAGKPFLGRNTVLRVSSLAGKGTLRDPYFVHVTDDEGHFWQFPLDDIVPAEENVSHAAKKSPAQLQREIDEALTSPASTDPKAHATKRTAGGKPISKPGPHGTLYRHSIVYTDQGDSGFGEATWNTWAYDPQHAVDRFYESPDGDTGWV